MMIMRKITDSMKLPGVNKLRWLPSQPPCFFYSNSIVIVDMVSLLSCVNATFKMVCKSGSSIALNIPEFEDE